MLFFAIPDKPFVLSLSKDVRGAALPSVVSLSNYRLRTNGIFD